MNRTTHGGGDYYWTRDADETMGLDYSGYGFYGQSEPSPTTTYASPATPNAPETSWTQPGVGYAPSYTPGAVVPMPTPYFYAPLMNHPNSTASIVLGVLGLVMFPPLSYISLVMAMRGRKDAQTNPGTYSEDSLTAGLVLGAIGSVLCTIYIMFVGIAMMAFMFSY